VIERIVPREPYPVARKAAEIISELLSRGVTRFLALFRGNRSRSEIVATFIAVLELSRTKEFFWPVRSGTAQSPVAPAVTPKWSQTPGDVRLWKLRI
jgi:hypothetical protein